MCAVTALPPVMVVRLTDARQSDLHPSWPDDAILDVASDASEYELLHFWHILQLGSRAEERSGGEIESEVGVKRDVHRRVGVGMRGSVR